MVKSSRHGSFEYQKLIVYICIYTWMHQILAKYRSCNKDHFGTAVFQSNKSG